MTGMKPSARSRVNRSATGRVQERHVINMTILRFLRFFNKMSPPCVFWQIKFMVLNGLIVSKFFFSIPCQLRYFTEVCRPRVLEQKVAKQRDSMRRT